MNNRFDPRTIFLSTIFFTVSLIMMKNINQIIFFIIVIIIHILFVGINVGNILKIFLASIWLLLSIIFINYFLIGRDVYYILNTAFRLFFIIILAAVMLSSMTVIDIGFAIEKIFYPLKYLKIPIENISIIIALSLKFIPLIRDEAVRIFKAQKARGLDYDIISIYDKILNITSIFIPIVVLAIQSSIKTAIAMEIRGYSDNAKKTRLYESNLKLKDYVYILFSIICFFLNLLLRELDINIYKYFIL